MITPPKVRRFYCRVVIHSFWSELIYYKGRCLEKKYVSDLVCYGTVLVELKALKQIGSLEESQMLNYPRATGLRVGIIISFGDPGRLDWKRMVR